MQEILISCRGLLDNSGRATIITNVIIAAATIAIAISTGIYTHYAGKQWEVMDNTLHQSKLALDSAIENFRLDQRAWVGPTEVLPPEYTEGGKRVYVKEGQRIKGGVIITNSGKTPARKLHTLQAKAYLSSGIKFSPKFKSDTTYQPSIDVLQPGMKLSLSTLPSPFVVTKENIVDITSGRLIVYMFGIINYEDVFGRPHSTKFCMFLLRNLSTFRGCDVYNEAD